MKIHGGRTAALFERWYLPVLLTIWAFAPGLRRVVDWQVGRTPLSIISILPMLALLPLVVVVFRSAFMSRVQLPFKALTYLWLFGFVYAFVVAFAAGGRLGPIYDFAQFCLPLLVGAWVILRPASRSQTFATLTTTMLWLGAIVSGYGIYQYVAPPPWDVAYVNNANQISLGVPEPYQLHPFSVLNSPGTLSLFLAVAILLSLGRLSLRRPWALMSVTLCVAALILTNVRSAWLALVVGVVAYLILSPRRGRTFVSLGAVALVSLVLLLNASTLLGGADTTSQLQARFSSLGNVENDESVTARREESNFALRQALEEPLGQGLGTVGGAVKLGGGGGSMVLDNGYLSRLLEMGIAGFICYLAALAFAVIFGLRALVRGFRNGDRRLQEIALAGLSVQAALLGLDLSSDYHNALPGMFFWLVVGLAIRHEPGDESQRPAWERLMAAQPPASPTRPRWA
jgi:O-antigen ligase